MLAITNLSGTHERGHPGMPQAWPGRWAIFGFFLFGIGMTRAIGAVIVYVKYAPRIWCCDLI
jgi:hypothetical protein